MQRGIFVLISLFACSQFGFAQELITGRVVDETNNEPLEYVAITVGKQNKRGVFTDANGYFSIEKGNEDLISFYLFGYEKKILPIGNLKQFNVSLKAVHTQLSEAVVIGYSTVERRDLTGSVASIKLREQNSLTSLDQSLMGQAPGVYVSNSSGALGGANLLSIRGISSIIGDNNPLYVIDGVPIYSTDRSSNSVGTTGGSIAAISMGGTHIGGGSLKNNTELNYSFEKNPLLSLNVNDIESIEILKDAYATAIYGSRGSAGVVLITTKKGKRDNAQVSLSYAASFERPLGKLALLNGDEYSAIYSQYYPNDRYNAGFNTDWLDEITRTAFSHRVSASISGGTDKSNYFVSLSGADNESYIINNSLSQYSARANLSTSFSEKWMMGVNMTLSNVKNNALSAPDIYDAAIKKAPNLPVYDGADYYYGYAPNSKGNPNSYNPVAMAYINDEFSEDFRTIGNMYLEYKPYTWLTLKSEIGMDISNSRSYVKKGKLPATVTGVPNNQAQENSKFNYRTVVNNTINVAKVVREHFIQGVLGQSYENAKEYGNTISGSDFFSPYLVGIGSAQTTRVGSTGSQQWALFSAFARLNYQYKMRYMAGVTYRLDGSSRFNKDNRFLHIPSTSIGWRLSEEDFIKNKATWIDDLKIRSSVGWSSKDGNSGYYGAQAVYTLNSVKYGGNTYLKMSQPGNDGLKWEKTITYDIGLDAILLNNRIDITFDYYYKKTIDMLFSSDLPIYTGYVSQIQNIADMQNTGLELRLVTYNITTPTISWQTVLNLSRSTNKILKLNFTGTQLEQANSSYKYYAVGYPLAQWYLHEWAGVDPATGNPLWKYADGSIRDVPPAADFNNTNSNKFLYGTAVPDVYGGLTNVVTYKNWELSAMFSFALGGRMINSTKAFLMTYSTSEAYNLSKDILNFWQIDGQKTDVPKLNNKSIMSGYDYTAAITTTRFMEDNSYLRLKNIELVYTCPQSWLKVLRIGKDLKFSISATNLLTFTKYSGIDPEVSAYGSSYVNAGYDNMTMPQSRGFQFGIRFML